MASLCNYIKLLRPEQWVKNVFVLMPLFFNGSMLDGAKLADALWVFAAFCLISSSVYCINDAADAAADRLHPRKRQRPVSSGLISARQAYITATLLAVSVLPICLFGGICHPASVIALIYTYLLINIGYCYGLKRFAVIDVTILSLGYVLRVWAGGVGTSITLSSWIIAMTFLLSLFLSVAKRRDDVTIYQSTGTMMRSNTAFYSSRWIDMSLRAIAGVTFACYMLYTVSDEVMQRFDSHYVYITSVFVLLGLLRYLHITIVQHRSGNPTWVLLHDHLLQLYIALWILTFAFIIY